MKLHLLECDQFHVLNAHYICANVTRVIVFQSFKKMELQILKVNYGFFATTTIDKPIGKDKNLKKNFSKEKIFSNRKFKKVFGFPAPVWPSILPITAKGKRKKLK